jgi:hypothetical protein
MLWSQGYEKSIYEDKTMILFGVEKADHDTLRYFYMENRHSNKREPDLPLLIFSSHDTRFQFAIGGYLKLTTAYDFGGVINNNDFITSLIPVNQAPGNNQAFRMDASTSMLSFKAIANTEKVGLITGYISADFRGTDLGFKLQNAYITFAGFTFGYTLTTFWDGDAEPPTIDPRGPNAMTLTRNLQIRYTYDFSKHWQIAAAIENPQNNQTVSPPFENINQRVPDFPVYLQYTGNNGSHIRVSSVFRDLMYRNAVTEKTLHNLGWGAQASTMIHAGTRLSFYGQGVYGEGISAYIQDISKSGMDMLPEENPDGSMVKIPAYGWYAGIKYNFSPAVYSSASYSQVRTNVPGMIRTPELYKFSQYIVGNVFWNVTPNCKLGIEYLHGTRENANGESGKANRLQAMVSYDF